VKELYTKEVTAGGKVKYIKFEDDVEYSSCHACEQYIESNEYTGICNRLAKIVSSDGHCLSFEFAECYK
jgi:hypothetical protein